MSRQYGKLNHPELVDQLRPYIIDKSKNEMARDAAIEIADDCKVQQLQNNLAEIALDQSQPFRIRDSAARVAVQIGDEETRSKLKPLAMGEAGDDPEDQLKGHGLKALWPNHMTAEELFIVLTPPKKPNFCGAYQTFIYDQPIKHLKPDDLILSLRWIMRNGIIKSLSFPIKKLTMDILLKAWENLQEKLIAKYFVKIILDYLKNHCYIDNEEFGSRLGVLLAQSEIKRHLIIEKIIQLISNSSKDLNILLYHDIIFLMDKDIPWLINKLHRSKSEIVQRKLAYLITKVFRYDNVDLTNAVLAASKKNTILCETARNCFNPVILNSPEAEQMKENYKRFKESQNKPERNKENPLLKPTPDERIETCLRNFESGELDAWWRLTMGMTLEPTSTHYSNEHKVNLKSLPGWRNSDNIIKGRIILAAKKYVLSGNPQKKEWWGKNISYRPAAAGYKALYLLIQESPDFIYTLSPEIWKKWTCVIISQSHSSSNDDNAKILLKLAYKHIPAVFIEDFMDKIDIENAEGENCTVIYKIECCFDDRLANTLLNKLKDQSLKLNFIIEILRILLDQNVQEAKKIAEGFIKSPLSGNCENRKVKIKMAVLLMEHANDSGWPAIWPAILSNTEFGRALISGIAEGRFISENMEKKLTEQELGSLYLWLVEQFPYDEDPKPPGAVYTPSPREFIGRFRDSVRNYLSAKGTPESCEVLEQIVRQLPEIDWLKYVVLEAKETMRRKTWRPNKPGDILKITQNRENRLVENGEQLLDVIIQSLRRLEEKLHDETPSSRDIWDYDNNKKTYRPIDENAFSDYIKRHLDEELRDKGIIINREVRIHRGQSTDIRVEAVVQSETGESYDVITVIIEVKGCWNNDLSHAMKIQLVDRYISDNKICRHGLFLVGWFFCELWDDKDSRKTKTWKSDRRAVQNKFDKQAVEVSNKDILIKAFVMNTELLKPGKVSIK
jgi:hypothetical protein